MIPEPRDGSVVLAPFEDGTPPLAFQRRDHWSALDRVDHQVGAERWYPVGLSDIGFTWSALASNEVVLVHEGKPA